MDRRGWLEQVHNRQRNIVPEDTIRNDALAEGFLIRGDRQFTSVQRVAAIVLGFLPLTVAIFALWAAIDILSTGDFRLSLFLMVLPILLFSIGFGYIAYRMMRNGITGATRHGKPR